MGQSPSDTRRSAYPDNVERARLGYAQKVTLTEISHILEKDCCDLLRKLNNLRQKVAHQLEYKVSKEDKRILTEGIAGTIEGISEETVFARLAPFLAGYLSGGVKLAQLAAKNIPHITIQGAESPG